MSQTKLAKISLLIIFLTLSGHAIGYGYLTSLGGEGVTIKSYFVHNQGSVSLLLEQDLPLNPDNCSVKNHVYIKNDRPGHKTMIAAAMAAFSAGKKVGFHGYGCEIIPFWGGTLTRPTVSELWVID
ncbi:MAG: hypothetical protein ACFHVJ_15830 [Aestuariibacter sp.]